MDTPVVVQAPASKSLSHRAVIAASLAEGTSLLRNVLESEDLTRSREVLAACGASIRREAPGRYSVTGLNGAPCGRTDGPEEEALSCFMGESGTSCRLLTAVLAAGRGRFRIHGKGRLHERPMADLVDALRELGASIRYERKNGCPPLLLDAAGLSSSAAPGGFVPIRCGESSQYLSGLLLAAPLGQGLDILLDGRKVVSWPYVRLTLQTLEEFGIPFTVECRGPDGKWAGAPWRTLSRAVPGTLRFRVGAAPYRARTVDLEGDYSSASCFLAAGALGPRPVTVLGLRRDSLQGDAVVLDILLRMGAAIDWREDAVTVSPAPLTGIEVDLADCPDLAPALAVLGAMSSGVTRLRNAAHLRGKESDRLLAPAVELRKIGCRVDLRDDGLDVSGLVSEPQGSVEFSAHNDHRMAMSLALLERNPKLTVRLDDPSCVAKSFPHFWTLWRHVYPQAGSDEKRSV
jgi:3-phosphoshikimate 1-carboxyvinyltransferase